MRTLDATQTTLLAEPSTAPIYLIDIDMGAGVERLSSNGDQVVGAISYTGAEIGVAAIDDWRRASLRLSPSSARAAQVITGAWRGTSCTISLLPCVRYPQIFEEGYVEAGYGVQGVTYGDPIVLLSGLLVSAQLGDSLEVGVTHPVLVAKTSPRIRMEKPVLNHMPAPGTQFVWGGETYTLEAR